MSRFARTRARPVVPEGISLTPLLCPNFIIDVQATAKRQTETRYGRTWIQPAQLGPRGEGCLGASGGGIGEWEEENS